MNHNHHTDQKPLTLAVYSGDVWEHVCPVIRLTAPAEISGMNILRGNAWANGELVFDVDPISAADLVVVLRDFPRYQTAYRQVVQKARDLGKKIVYGIDDLLIDLPAEHPGAAHYRGVRPLILGAILEADAVMVTTPPLRDALTKHNPKILVLPNYLDDQVWALQPQNLKQSDAPVVIGYQGGNGHIPDLEMITPALVRVLERYKDRVKFKFWGTQPPAALLEWPNVEWLDIGLVDYAAFARYFQNQQCDLFIAPIANNLFNACKSPLKFLEYSALGIPGIYSQVIPYESVVTEGLDGLLVTTLEEWESALCQLIDDPDARMRLGQAAQNTVRQKWLLSEHAAAWPQAFASVLSQPALEQQSPMIQELVTLTSRWSEDLERMISSQQTELQAYQEKTQYLQTDLNNITNSLGWRLLMGAHQVVDKIAPAGSFRGKAFRRGLRLLKRLPGNNRAPAIFGPGSGESIYVINGNENNPLRVSLQAGTTIQSPAISLLVPCQEGAPVVNEANLRKWVAEQTFQDVEIVMWEPSHPSAQDLLQQIHGKYVCFASPDTLTQNTTYLEGNLAALESEGLAFTLNAIGSADWMAQRVRAGSLPGSRQFPFLRQMVRKDCLDQRLNLNLSGKVESGNGQPVVVGKIIVHTSSQVDAPEVLPYNQDLAGLSVSLLGSYVLAYPFSKSLPAGSIRHTVLELDTVLPKARTTSDLPVVLMFMPVLAMGGAETIHLNMMRYLQNKARFVVVTFETHDRSLGTTVEEFRKITPYVYTLPDYLLHHLNFSMVRYLFDRFQPVTLYIANGANWIYDMLPEIRKTYPGLHIANQVYDHQAGWINRYDRKVVRSIDVHIGSNYQIDKEYNRRGARQEQIHHIENGVDTEKFNPSSYTVEDRQQIKNKLGLPLDRKIVTFMARLHPQKRPVDFVEMARHCINDASMAFLMIGDGVLAEAVQNELKRIDLPNFYRFPFYRPSSDIFAVTDILVMTSEYEGMPMVVLEAQSMGKPVVATDVGNIREIISKTQGGAVVTAVGDINGLIAAVRGVLAAPPDPETVRKGIQEHYSLLSMADGYERALLTGLNA
jgi:glycosyltransferase involved in cell wall biosynthesis